MCHLSARELLKSSQKEAKKFGTKQEKWARLGTTGLSGAVLLGWPKLVTLGKFSGALAKIHRTVRCAPDMSSVSSAQRLFAHSNGGPHDQRGPRQHDNGREGHRTCPVCHRTIWCPTEKEDDQSIGPVRQPEGGGGWMGATTYSHLVSMWLWSQSSTWKPSRD
jgi:hypothetical protein